MLRDEMKAKAREGFLLSVKWGTFLIGFSIALVLVLGAIGDYLQNRAKIQAVWSIVERQAIEQQQRSQQQGQQPAPPPNEPIPTPVPVPPPPVK